MTTEPTPLRVAALVKQIPRFEAMTLGTDGRLQRQGLELEMNAYCRRAVSKAVELVHEHGGEVVVLTLGPLSAEDTLREAIVWGTDRDVTVNGVLVTDAAFAGSDTLATARALTAALVREGPFDLVLTGRNSVDADTGQVGPEVAELLDLPFLTGVKGLELVDDEVTARCEHDDGVVWARLRLPAVLSVAERLIEPCKVEPDRRDEADATRIARLDAATLGDGPWGQDGSPTWVGPVRVLHDEREQRRLHGGAAEQVRALVSVLAERNALDRGSTPEAPVVPATGGDEAVVGVLAEPGRHQQTRELLGAAAGLAAELAGSTTALVPVAERDAAAVDPVELGGFGADEVLVLTGSIIEDDVAPRVDGWARRHEPWAILAPSTAWGREVAARVAARLDAGLTGDAVGLDVEEGRLVAWKPAFGGKLVAGITATSTVQMATVRPGVLASRRPREHRARLERGTVEPRGRVEVLARDRDDDLETLALADVVVGVGMGLEPTDYPALDGLLEALGAELGATRKVTDRGWLPRARQVGITGRSIAPRLYVSIGSSGKFNHSVGFRSAGTVVAINSDPDAPIHEFADCSVLADWREVVPLLESALPAARGDLAVRSGD